MSLEATAVALRVAEQDRTPIAPLRSVLAPTDEHGAYAVQSVNVRQRLAEGARIVGRKIGLTSQSVQRQLNVDRPDYGVLFDDMAIHNGATVSANTLIQPKIEAEVAIVLSADLPDVSATAADVAAATGYAVAALEIVDSRIADWKITFADTVADNGSSARFVLGDDRKGICEFDPVACRMSLALNGELASEGFGGACLGSPLEAAAWLARTLAQRGEPLRKGDIVLTGALGPMVPIKAGDRISAMVEGLGSVSVTVGE